MKKQWNSKIGEKRKASFHQEIINMKSEIKQERDRLIDLQNLKTYISKIHF